jgi:DNA-binding CsgD family transcriptional regulator
MQVAVPKELAMTTNSGSDGLKDTVSSLPAAWTAASAEIVERMEEPILPELLVRALGILTSFEYCVLFVYRDRANPIHVYDTFVSPSAKAGLINYVKNTYVLNPFYNAYRRGLKTGAYRIRDLAPDGFFESEYFKKYKVSVTSSEEIGYLTEGWPPGREELCIAIEMPIGECAEITLSRKTVNGGFSADDIARLALAVPFLAAVFRRHWRQARFGHLANSGQDSSADDTLQTFGGSLLSPREREIAQLLLRGHSTLSISLHLKISATTVKTHRKNLYIKLGISTQFELFSLFLDSLRDTSPSGRMATGRSPKP